MCFKGQLGALTGQDKRNKRSALCHSGVSLWVVSWPQEGFLGEESRWRPCHTELAVDTVGTRVTPGRGVGRRAAASTPGSGRGRAGGSGLSRASQSLKASEKMQIWGFGAGSHLKSQRCPARSWGPDAGSLCAPCHRSWPVHTLKRQGRPWTVGWAGWCRNPPPARSQGEAPHVLGGRRCCRGPCLSPGWPWLWGQAWHPGQDCQGRGDCIWARSLSSLTPQV